MLQILVNHYNENEEIVKRFLSSLEKQINAKFEVMICSDGGEIKLDESTLKGYSFPISYAYAPHSGVCHTRNIMMDRATAEWVMFCDIDDYFHKENGLKSLLINSENADIVSSPYISEGYKNIPSEILEKDTIRVHSKIFRLNYLKENNIRFPDNLETSGDMMFLWLAFSLTEKIKWISNCFYTWAWNPNSITRKSPYFHYEAYPKTLACYQTLAENLIQERQRPDLLNKLLATLVVMTYLDWNNKRFSTYPREIIENVEKTISNFLKKYYNIYIKIPIELRKLGYDTMISYKQNENLSFVAPAFSKINNWALEMMEESQNEILIVGCGTVGQNLAEELKKLNPYCTDKYKNIEAPNKLYKLAFICVNTPRTNNNACDTSEVWNAIKENDAEIYVIKSTIPIGETERIIEKIGKKVIFSPEYYGSTQHCNNFDFNFTILGGDKKTCATVQQILQKVYDARHIFKITDSKTAELAKYMENAWIATKVSFCNQFYEIAEKEGLLYEELRELFVLDPRVNPAHTFVYRDHPYWESHCLDKDVPAIAELENAKFLKNVIKYNENQKREHSLASLG